MTKRILLILVVAFVAIQLYRPARTNPPEDPSRHLNAVAQVPPDVQHIFDGSCNDCHSYRTVWPWYSKVAPSSWLVASDVNDGRRHLNFSEFANYKTERQQRKLGEICDEVSEGGMPLRQYTWIHTGSKLSQQQREAVCNWVKAEQARITARTGVPVPSKKEGGMSAADNKEGK